MAQKGYQNEKTQNNEGLNDIAENDLPVCWNFSQSRDIDDLEQRSIRDTVVWLQPALSIPMACPRSSVLSLAIETMLFVLSHRAIVWFYAVTAGFKNSTRAAV